MTESFEEQLKELIYKYKIYGKPDCNIINHMLDNNMLEFLVNTASGIDIRYITSLKNKFNELWINTVDVADNRSVYYYYGGIHFYEYIIQHKPTSIDELKDLINKYDNKNIIDISSIEKLFNEENIDNKIYSCTICNDDTIYLMINTDEVNIINPHGDIVGRILTEDFNKVIKHLSFRQKYTGINTNKFVNEPNNILSAFKLASFIQEYYFKDKESILQGDNKSAVFNSSVLSQASDQSESSYKSYETTNAVIAEKALYSDESDKANSAESASEAVEAESASEADKAIIADTLSDEGVDKIADKVTTMVLQNDHDILDKISEKLVQKHKEELLKYKATQWNGEFKTKNIYSDNTLKKVKDILEETGRVLISGTTGSGKTELAYWLAYEYTGKYIGAPMDSIDDTGEYEQVCVVSARNETEGLMHNSETSVGKLYKFINYIKEKADNTCKYVFICNEIQASDAGFLIGNLWEKWNSPNKAEGLPENLYIIFTGCIDSDFGIDEQVTRRIREVKLPYIRENENQLLEKLVNIFKNEQTISNYKLEQLLTIIVNINTVEGMPVFSIADFMQVASGHKLMLSNYFDIVSDKESLAKLEEIQYKDENDIIEVNEYGSTVF